MMLCTPVKIAAFAVCESQVQYDELSAVRSGM
jgi:hypothetical protein